jgi:hypothetical protein
MQFSAYLGAGTSGMFCADQLRISEQIPYHDCEKSPEDEYDDGPAPKVEMSFVHDR